MNYGAEKFDKGDVVSVQIDETIFANTDVKDARSIDRRARANRITAQNQQGVRGKSGVERRNRKHTGAHR